MAGKRGRPPKKSPHSSNKQPSTPSRDVFDSQMFDLTQIDEDDLAEIGNLSPKQAQLWLKNLDLLRQRIKGKSVVLDDTGKDLSIDQKKDSGEPSNLSLNKDSVGKFDPHSDQTSLSDTGTVPEENISSAVEVVTSVLGEGAPLMKPVPNVNDKPQEEEGWTTVTRTRSAQKPLLDINKASFSDIHKKEKALNQQLENIQLQIQQTPLDASLHAQERIE
ncbi:hypothetical protein RIF29_25838 [Crotalaria pallida]|uniref:Uncharacterized protein n=1 Tax=Crotalaria pallida TaxID=3830 RepID=A0AAN9EM26_CROPI